MSDEARSGGQPAPIESVLRHRYGRLVYTHKTHEKDREISSRKSSRVRWFNVLLTAATALSLVAAAWSDEAWVEWLAGVIGVITAAFAIYQLSFDHDTDAERHRSAAKDLLTLRDQLETLIGDLRSGLSEIEVTAKRDDLFARIDAVYKHAPNTSAAAYRAAKRALQVDDEMTFSEDEIDSMLPSPLRLSDESGEAPPSP